MAVILLLEDDKNLNNGIQIALRRDKHEVVSAFSFFEGVEKYFKEDIDLFLLDVNLPDGNGIDFCTKIRESSDKPIIFLTANDTENDMIKGFRAGCDDYMAKPFSVEVLREKVKAILRRFSDTSEDLFKYKDLEVNFDKRKVIKNGMEVKLTATEYDLLYYMIKNQGKVLTRNMILNKIWDNDGNFVDTNTLNVHIRRLRQKLENDDKSPEFIITVFKVGYTFGK